MEALTRADVWLLLWLNAWVGVSHSLDTLIRFVASDYLIPVVLSLVLLGMWFAPREQATRMRYQRAALGAMAGMGFSVLAVAIINELMFRPRPFDAHPVALLFYRATDSSFPLHAAAVGFGFATGIWMVNRKLGTVAGALAGCWGLARVIAGVAYPSDLLGGMVIGITVTSAFFVVLQFFDPLVRFVLRTAQRFYLA